MKIVPPRIRSASNACIGCANSAMTKFVMSTILLIGLSPTAVSRHCSHSGRGPDRHVVEDQRTIPRTQLQIGDLHADGAIAGGQQVEIGGVLQFLSGDRRDLARHSVMAPQIGPVGDGLVVDLDRAIDQAAGKRRPDLRLQLDYARMILVDAQFRRAGEHAVALDAIDHLLPDRRVCGDQARPAVRRAADDRAHAVPAGVHHCLNVMAAGNRLDRFDTRRARFLKQPPTFSMPSHSAVFIVMRRSSASGAASRPSTNSRIQL